MKKTQRSEIVDYQTYGETREEFQRQVFAAKARRRIHLGDCFTFLFENALSIRYQVQEMMLAEKIVKENLQRTPGRRGTARLCLPDRDR
jgi:hypothetical protein